MTDGLTLDWYEISNPSPGVFALMEPLHAERVLSYLVVGSDRAILIDSGTGATSMMRAIEALTDRPVLLVNSHSHWDHIGNNHEFAGIAIHREEAAQLAYRYQPAEIAEFFADDALLGPLPNGRTVDQIVIGPSTPTQVLEGGERFDLGGRSLVALHTPGHAPGLISLLDEENGVLFSTDTAYPGPLYAYSAETDLDTYIRSMELLAGLASSVRYVHPSHNADSMPAELLPKMRDALIDVAAGRAPDAIDTTRATYRFDGFAVYGPLPQERR